jgi:MerR family mercuric resistance operon transcriptional regulator
LPPVVGNVISLIDYHGLTHASCSDYRIKDNFMPAITSSRAENLSIGELSKHSGVNIETIRYYERVEMLAPPPRTAGGRRVYDTTDLRTLFFIRRSRELGFSLGEIRALLRLGGPGKASCREVREIAARHLEDIRAKLSDLKKLERVLSKTVARCSGGTAPDCAVLDILDIQRAS